MKKLKTTLAFLCAFTCFQAVGQSVDIDINTLIKELGIRESKEASRDMTGWSRPEKITMRFNPSAETGFGSKEWIQEVADGVEIEFVSSIDEIKKSIVDSDVYIGGCSDVILTGKNLDYVHITSAGIDRCNAIPGLKSTKLITTNNAKVHSETIAEHAISMMLALTRNLPGFFELQAKSNWNRGNFSDRPQSMSVKGKTLLVLGLGGIGNQAAIRGYNLGMRVIGTRNSSRNGPDYVDYVGLSDETVELAKQADVVINALPLTSTTRGIVGKEFFGNLKEGSYYISVGRGPTTDTGALLAALKSGDIGGAGLDVTDPEPLPEDHELWSTPNVIITQHSAGRSDLTSRNSIMITRENIRRYIQGEKLLNMTDFSRGY